MTVIIYIYTVVSRNKNNLSLSTKRRGGLCAGCDDFSLDYAPLPVPVKHDLIVGSGGGGGGGGGG